MWLPTVKCILLACLVSTIAAEDPPRSKRDLMLLKDMLVSKFFGTSLNSTENSGEPILIKQDGDVKIYKIPGFEKILIRAVPKTPSTVVQAVPVPEQTVVIDPTIEILKSYLGTQSHGEVLSALHGVKNLLHSGILLKPKPVISFREPGRVPVIPALPPPILQPVPVSVQPIKIPIGPTKYSYDLIKNDGSVVRYSSKNSRDVIVTYTNQPMPPPPVYIMDRFQQLCFGVPVGMKPVPVRPAVAPILLNPPLPPLQSVDVYPEPTFDVPIRSAGVLVQEPVPIPKPLHILERIENGPSKVGGYSFIINGEHVREGFLRHSRPHHTSGPLFEPFISRHVTGPLKTNPYKYPTRPSGKYSYQQVHHDGTLTTNSEGEIKRGNPVVLMTETSKAMPLPPVHLVERIEKVAATAHTAKLPKTPSGYSYKIVNNGATLHTGGHQSAIPQAVKVDKASVAKKAGNMFFYKTVANGATTTHLASGGVTVSHTKNPIPAPPSHIVNRIEKVAAMAHAAREPTSGQSYKLVNNNPHLQKSEIHTPKPHMFQAPIPSTYIYKQINSNNPIPFTVVKVGDEPSLAMEEVAVKTNKHEHVQSDGTKYPCNDAHAPNQPNIAIVSEIPSGFVYVPPRAADKTPISSQQAVDKQKVKQAAAQFSYKHSTSQGTYEYNNQQGSVDFRRQSSQTEKPKVSVVEKSTKDDSNSFTNNPIVVLPGEHSFSHTQTKPDGGSISVHGNSKNVVSVEVTEGERTDSTAENVRGDIPEAFS